MTQDITEVLGRPTPMISPHLPPGRETFKIQAAAAGSAGLT